MNRSIVFRIFLSLLLIGIVAAAGVFAYNAGLAHGLAQNIQAAGGEDAASTFVHSYRGMPFGHLHGVHAFGFLGCLVPLFLLFLFFGVTRALFWHGHHAWGHHGWYGHGGKWDDGIPSRVQEWHRRMHEEEAEKPDEK